MTAAEIVEQLKPLASESTKKVLLKHGIEEPLLGVKIEHLKKLQKRIKRDHLLALELFDTGIYDAMYLAGLIADEQKMTKRDLKHWLAKGTSAALCGNTIAWIAAESRYGWELALEWIGSKQEKVALTGWSTLASLVAIKADADLDLAALQQLMQRVEKGIGGAPNRVRYAMNGFLIAVGSYVQPLADIALQTAERIGKVTVDMGDTACQVPFAPDYIKKVHARGALGKKRKTARC